MLIPAKEIKCGIPSDSKISTILLTNRGLCQLDKVAGKKEDEINHSLPRNVYGRSDSFLYGNILTAHNY